MKILVAAAAGMCFGVRDALDILANIDQPSSFAIYGELVHNNVVLLQLKTRGFETIAESQRDILPSTSNVVITAHGISEHRRRQLIDAGKTLVDTTCPLVARVHRATRDLASAGAFVVVIGHSDHVEVQGITGDLKHFAVVKSVMDVGTYPATKIGVVCQTTFPCHESAAIRQQIQACNPTAEIEWVDTICQPTKDRQQALTELLDKVQAMVVVGGSRSHNTRRLIETCRQRGVATFPIENAEELEAEWFDGFETVGLTAGTSTLPETLEQVHERLKAIASKSGSAE